MLRNLEDQRGFVFGEISQTVDISTLQKLNQLGTIVLTLGGGVMISPIGRKVVLDLSHS